MSVCISTAQARTKRAARLWLPLGLGFFTCTFPQKNCSCNMPMCISIAQARTKCGSRSWDRSSSSTSSSSTSLSSSFSRSSSSTLSSSTSSPALQAMKSNTALKQWNHSITKSCGNAKIQLFPGGLPKRLLRADTTYSKASACIILNIISSSHLIILNIRILHLICLNSISVSQYLSISVSQYHQYHQYHQYQQNHHHHRHDHHHHRCHHHYQNDRHHHHNHHHHDHGSVHVMSGPVGP